MAAGLDLAQSVSRLRRSTFLRHSSLVFASAMLVNVCAFVFHARTSRALGVEQYGALYALMALLPLFAIPATVLSTVVSKFAAEFRALHDDSHLHALVRRIALALAVCGALVAVVGFGLQVPIARFFNVEPAALAAASVLVALTIMLPPLRAVLQGIEDFGRFAASSTIEGLFKAGLGILFALIGFGVAGALYGYALGSAVALAYTWIVLERMFAGAVPQELRIDVRRVLQTVAGAAVLTVTITALSYADALIVKHYMPASEAGFYAAVSLGGKILLFIASFVPLVLLPKAASSVAKGTSPLPTLGAAATMWALLSGAGLAFFFLAARLILRTLVGPQFLPASGLLFEYALAMVLLGGMNLVASYKIALHRFDFVYPFIVVTAGELAGIALYHPDLRSVIDVLIAGNAVGLLAGCYRINSWRTDV